MGSPGQHGGLLVVAESSRKQRPQIGKDSKDGRLKSFEADDQTGLKSPATGRGEDDLVGKSDDDVLKAQPWRMTLESTIERNELKEATMVEKEAEPAELRILEGKCGLGTTEDIQDQNVGSDPLAQGGASGPRVSVFGKQENRREIGPESGRLLFCAQTTLAIKQARDEIGSAEENAHRFGRTDRREPGGTQERANQEGELC